MTYPNELTRDRNRSNFAWIAGSLLRVGGWGCPLSVEAHFDESGTDAAELTVAGYLFEASRIDEFCSRWDAVLAEYGVPYFHMVDCAQKAKHFADMDRNDTIRIAMKLMRLIKWFSINGVVCNVPNVPANSRAHYFDAAQRAARMVSEWAEATTSSEPIAYFFEAGADGWGLVDGWFKEISKAPDSRSKYRYAGHASVPKEGNPGVQAADLLAWQYHNFTKKRAAKDLARLDLRALLRHPHAVADECGEPPRKSEFQSIRASRQRMETVHYLPTVDKNELAQHTVIKTGGDFNVFNSTEKPGLVLACPNCLRAVSEGFGPDQIRSIVIECWCGTFCLAPRQLPPYANY